MPSPPNKHAPSTPGMMFMTRIAGNGVAFLSGGGTIMQKQLQPGERYMLGDTQSFMAAEASIKIGPLAL